MHGRLLMQVVIVVVVPLFGIIQIILPQLHQVLPLILLLQEPILLKLLFPEALVEPSPPLFKL